MTVLRAAAYVALVGLGSDLGSGAALGRERQAGLYALDIFSDAAPRPPLAVPGATRTLDRSVTTAPSKPHTNASAPHVAGPLAVHPTASMFPPVVPLE